MNRVGKKNEEYLMLIDTHSDPQWLYFQYTIFLVGLCIVCAEGGRQL